ncbi:hypothetical protein Pyn_19812 [Prunus yedoensis var. nudiflora]|uniref:Uncharacterized protein n=1 Tax=Prunus yedoensis var. nudiflora TaxID=2094558 RepID=A0A314XIF2_PRUYE|nr:hypothetical protein Pyn_19812 [Prunus yedoensis var. nudiflora]
MEESSTTMWPGTSRPTGDWALSTHIRILNTHAPVTSPMRADYPAKGLRNTLSRVPEFRSDPSIHIRVSISKYPSVGEGKQSNRGSFG